MAKRRMFTMDIVDSDAFLEMPDSSQNLYFHLGMRSDDDGFNDSPKKIMKMVGAGEDDLKILLAKRFILAFQNGVIVIKHWRMHNYIAKDRYVPTKYADEMAQLQVKDNGSYTECIQSVYVGKDSIGKDSIGKLSIESTHKKELINDTEKSEFIDYMTSKGASPEFAENELAKFISYWSEKNQSGTKERWQMEKTFEVKKRLFTWLNNIKQFNGGQNAKRGIRL